MSEDDKSDDQKRKRKGKEKERGGEKALIVRREISRLGDEALSWQANEHPRIP
jgi:hypothetical protein